MRGELTSSALDMSMSAGCVCISREISSMETAPVLSSSDFALKSFSMISLKYLINFSARCNMGTSRTSSSMCLTNGGVGLMKRY